MKAELKTATLLGVLFVFMAPASPAQDVMQRLRQLDAQARTEERAGNAEAAIQDYQEILKLDPKLYIGYNQLGRLYYQRGRFQDAVTPLRRAAGLAPQVEAPKALLGLCHFQMGDFVTARREFQTALKLDPGDAAAKFYLARGLMELDGAKNVEALFSPGWLYTGLAVSTLDAIHRIDPESYLTEFPLGKYAETKQTYAEAVEHYKKAIEKSPNQTELYYCYAHTLYPNGEFKRALQEYQHVLEMNPHDYPAHWEAARIVLPESPQKAQRLAGRSLELRPGTYGALEIRGRAFLALGETSSGIPDFKQVATLNPQYAANHFQLARAYPKAGMTQEAQAETTSYERIQSEAHFPTKVGAPAVSPASPATP